MTLHSTLQVLDLSDNSWYEDEAISVAASLEYWSALEKLKMTGSTALDDDVMTPVSRWLSTTSVRFCEVDLSGQRGSSRISDAGVLKILQACPLRRSFLGHPVSFGRLVALNLSGHRGIGDRSARHFAAALQSDAMCHLETLNLHDTSIRKRGSVELVDAMFNPVCNLDELTVPPHANTQKAASGTLGEPGEQVGWVCEEVQPGFGYQIRFLWLQSLHSQWISAVRDAGDRVRLLQTLHTRDWSDLARGKEGLFGTSELFGTSSPGSATSEDRSAAGSSARASEVE